VCNLPIGHDPDWQRGLRRHGLDVTYDYVQLNWVKLKPKIRQHWGKITQEDMAHLNGKSEELINILRKRYGYGKAQAQIEIHNWVLELEDKSIGAKK
jgi:uncharacterized protein YjbJ (UPF0337 family)